VTTVISQGSVATRLRCGGQCDSHFVANFLTNSTMEKFRKSVNICQSYGQKYRGPFLTHSVYTPCPPKKLPTFHCLYLRQILADFHSSSTGVFCEKSAISDCQISHRTLTALLHYLVYLVKYKFSNITAGPSRIKSIIKTYFLKQFFSTFNT